MKLVQRIREYGFSKFLSSRTFGISATQLNTFRVKQVIAATRLLKMTQPINMFNAFLLGYLFFDSASHSIITAYVITICVIAVSWLTWAIFFWEIQFRKGASPLVYYIHVSFSAIMSTVFGFFCCYLFVDANAEQRLILIAIFAGMISGGAFALCTIPRAALAWVIPQCVISALALLTIQSIAVKVALIGLLVIYSFLIMTTVLSIYSMYILRLKAEDEAQLERQDAEYQKDMIKLLMRDFEDHVNDWLWEISPTKKLRQLSKKIIDDLQLNDEKIVEIGLATLFLEMLAINGEQQHEKFSILLDKLEEKFPFNGVVVPVRIRNEISWLSMSGKPLYDRNKQFVGWRGFCTDITSDYLHTQQIEYLANFDSLTGLPNRNYFSRHFSEKNDDSRPFALMMIDLDNFKEVNDVFGHSEGDSLLKMVAKRFSEHILDDDILTRFGGDEFVLVTYSPQNAAGIAAKLLGCLKKPMTIQNATVEINATIGISLSQKDGSSENDLFGKADMAMYDAKLSGKNKFVFFDADIESRLIHRNEMISDLKLAIEREEFHLVYQPQVDTEQANRVFAFEALLRWQHPIKGLIAPSEFIPLAEEAGMINEIGIWVLTQACIQALNWPAHIIVSVNVSGIEFSSDNYVDCVINILETTGLDPKRLELEVTESAIINNIDLVNEKLTLLQKSNVQIALDDFGTGFSSLAYIQNLSINKLKLDSTFVTGLGLKNDRNRSEAIIDIVVKLAKTLDVVMIVEGVETKEQLTILSELGCSNIQGYFFSFPKNPDDLHEFF